MASLPEERPKSQGEGGHSGPAKIEIPEEEAVSPPPAPEPQEKRPGGLEEGYYKVREGDTLCKIAENKDVYGDPSQWPSLYWLNAETLGGMR